MKQATLILAIGLMILVSACHRHSKHGDGWASSQTSAYEKTKDGYYRVRKGDTLHAIAFNYGMDWRDIASWNHIPAPYLIYPDQQLRLSPVDQTASSSRTTTASSPGVTTSGVKPKSSSTTSQSADTGSSSDTTGLKTPTASTRTLAPASEPATRSAAPTTTAKTPSPRSSTPASQAPAGTDPSKWLWPTEGRIVSNFKANDPSRNGIEIGGAEGQPILSTAAGEVVYSGNGLIGYGELIIIKHSDRMLSAYAHNRKRLVSEGEKVGAGVKIAEMGRDDRNKPVLHFEIRINGSPGDPMKYLPAR